MIEKHKQELRPERATVEVGAASPPGTSPRRDPKPGIGKPKEELTKGMLVKVNKQTVILGVARLVIPSPLLLFPEKGEGLALE